MILVTLQGGNWKLAWYDCLLMIVPLWLMWACHINNTRYKLADKSGVGKLIVKMTKHKNLDQAFQKRKNDFI